MNSLWLRCLFFATAISGLLSWSTSQFTLEVEIQLHAPSNAQAEVYFTYDNSSFISDQRATLIKTGSTGHYLTTLVSRRPIQSLRIDPSDTTGEIVLGTVIIRGDGGETRWNSEALEASMEQPQQLKLKSVSADGLEFEATGDDPQFVLPVPAQIVQISGSKKAIKILGHFLLSGLAWLLLEVFYRWGNKPGSLPWKAHQKLQNAATRMSLDGPIVWRAGSLLWVISLLLAAMLSVSLKLHQSSIALWEGMFPSAKVTYSTLAGTPKAIRSDEWNTQTPWILNGVQRGMQLENKNVGAEQAALVAATPVLHPTMVAQPKFWGFLFLDIERGFAWLWAYRIFGMFSTFFLIFLFVTRGNTFLSATGSLWIFGSSYVQWWHSNNLGDILVGFGGAMVGAIYLLFSRGWKWTLFGSIVLSLALVNLVLHVYPPFMIPLAWFGAFILIASLTRDNFWADFASNFAIRIKFVSVALFIFVFLTAIWAWDANSTIKLMLGTVYPGNRLSLGGDFPWSRLVYGFFESWRINESTLPLPPTNATEASGFWLMFPLAFLLIPPKHWIASENRVLTTCLCFCLLLILWMSAPLPSAVRSAIAHLGWNRATPVRAVLGLGIASIFATVLLMLRSVENPIGLRKISPILIFLVVSFTIAMLGVAFKPLDPVFFTKWRVLGSATVAGLMALAIQSRSQWAFLGAVLVIISPSILVNPIQSGLQSIFSKPILSLAVKQSSDQRDRWAVVGSFILSQGLKARGLDVFTGTNYVPDLKSIVFLDPTAKYTQIWNRYAHLELESAPTLPQPEYTLTSTDQYKIRLDVCGPWLQRLGITKLAYTTLPPDADLNCLTELETDPMSGIRLFSLNENIR